MEMSILEAYFNGKKARCKHWIETHYLKRKLIGHMEDQTARVLEPIECAMFMDLMVETYENWEVMEEQKNELRKTDKGF